jgi:hypothetical protein
MATNQKTKTTVEENGEKTVLVEETKEATPAVAPQFTLEDIKALVQNAVADAVKAEREENGKKIAELEEQLKAEKALKAAPAPASTDSVSIVYLCDYDGVINRVPGLNLVFHSYGDTVTVSRTQFDAIVGEYRRWFDRTEDEYALSPKLLSRIGTMPVEELKKLWYDCKSDTERLSIVSYYKRKFIEGKEPGFRDTDRVVMMNALTGQGLKREAVEISGASLKIAPTDFMNY